MTTSWTYRSARVALVAFCLVLPLLPAVTSAAELYAEYHDLTSAQHATRAATLEADGYRPISLSISGDPADPRYAGAWVQRAGPAFSVFQDKTLAEYEAILAGLAPGQQPVIIGATGPDDASARFAGVIEATSKAFSTRQGIDTATLYQVSWAQDHAGYILRWLSSYGPADAPKYAAIWEENPQGVGSTYTYGNPRSLQREYLAVFEKNDFRPSLVVVTPGETYSTIWQDDRLDGGWKQYDELSQSQYEKRITALARSGWHVIRVTARGTGAGTRYTVIFAKKDVPQERHWQLTGSDDPTFAGFDAWVKARMQQNGTRAGQLAIVRDGRLVYARAYTWAESGYPLTQPTDLFRIASCTKPLTSIVVNQLVDRGLLQTSDTMQSILDLHPPGGGAPADPRFADITVAQMLAHASGLPGDVFNDIEVTDTLGTKLPVTPSQRESFVATQTLDFTPDNGLDYSNTGYVLLGRIVEKLRPGKTWAQTVKDFIYTPLGLKRPRSWGNGVRSTPHEVSYEPRSPMDVGSTLLNESGRVALGNHGLYNMKNVESSGGAVMSAPDYAKILAAFDQPVNPLLTQASADFMSTPHFLGHDYAHGWWITTVKDEHGNDVAASHHDGSYFGTAALIFRRADGISFVLLFNRNVVTYLWGGAEAEGGQLNDLANQVAVWPSGDLFPDYGIPSF